jgi:hypothetical protein
VATTAKRAGAPPDLAGPTRFDESPGPGAVSSPASSGFPEPAPVDREPAAPGHPDRSVVIDPTNL